MNRKLIDASTLLGLGVALFGVLQLLQPGWQQISVLIGEIVYMVLGVVGIIDWMRTDRGFLE